MSTTDIIQRLNDLIKVQLNSVEEALEKQERADEDGYDGNFDDANQVGLELGNAEGKLEAYQEILRWLE
jgi:flagellar hook-basal body complex protein FliE